MTVPHAVLRRTTSPLPSGGVSTIQLAVNGPFVVSQVSREGRLPLLIEAKSAGDFTNTNKRRKEEAMKIAQLHATHGKDVEFLLFLCGYFDSGYLGYEAAEGIDWIWEHRVSDFDQLGL